MPLIEVDSPGLLTTVQDLGRRGYGHLGVAPSGAADPVALRLGNLLAGNPPGAAGLEMTIVGGTFLFPHGATAALTGADMGPTLDGRPVPMGETLEIRPGQRLALGPARTGARCYLCVGGAVRVPMFLGSASTHLACGLGGLEGRRLRRGDVLEIGSAAAVVTPRRLSPQARRWLAQVGELRVTAGPEWERFAERVRETFLHSVWRVTADSDRAGLRLSGPSLDAGGFEPMISEGVDLGSVQAPPSGQPIILFVEQQTTGGYPRLAVVIAADLFRLGQLRPGDDVRFRLVALEEALRLVREQERLLACEEFLFET